MTKEEKIKIISFGYSLSTLIPEVQSSYSGKSLYKSRKVEHKIHFKLLSEYMSLFSKKELETNFFELSEDGDSNKKTQYSNIVIGENWLKFKKDLYEIIISADDYDFFIFFKVLMEKKCFENKLNDLSKLIIKNKKSANSLEYYHFLYINEKINYKGNDDDEYGIFKYSLLEYIVNGQFDDEKKEVLNIVLNKMSLDEILKVIDNLNNDEINLFILSNLKERNLDINKSSYHFNFLPKKQKESFFISSLYNEKISKLIKYGFNFKKYKFNGFDLIENMYFEIDDIKRKPDLDKLNLILEYINKNPETIKKYFDFFKKDEEKYQNIYPIIKEKLFEYFYFELNEEIDKKPEGLKRKI